jgi:radical SAM superfamily enzyme YgiQ (UPF0313 family)
VKTWICTTLCNFYAPLLGAARLYAYEKKQGHDVALKDFNQDAYFTILSRPYLEATLDRTRNSIDYLFRNKLLRGDMGSLLLKSSGDAMRQLVAKAVLHDASWYRYVKNTGFLKRPFYSLVGSRIKPENIVLALLSERDFVLGEIEKSRRRLDEQFFSLDTDVFMQDFQTLLCGKAIVDMAYFPAQIDFGLGFHGTAFAPRTGDILSAVANERHNFMIPYYRNKVIPLVEKERPGLVGISITCVFELIPALTLAYMIKKVDPGIHITLGGVLATQLSQRISVNRPLWDLFDSLVLGPGEVAFSELIDHVDKKADLSQVPNLIYRNNGSIRSSEALHEFDINDACTPEFVDLRPKSGLPLETASGCYWGKCIFCYYPQAGTATRETQYQKKRVRRMELVLDDIRKLRDTYDPLVIAITDSSMHPKRMEAIAEENLKSDRKVKFSALFRLEKEFKSKAFCRKLVEGGFLGGYVGLESGSPRVNNIINKGIDPREAEEIIKNFYATGILLHVFSIVGTPGETREDAVETYEFFKRLHRYLRLEWVIYYLYVLEDSPIVHRAEELGVDATPLPDDYLVTSMRYRTAQGLSQEESASLVLKFEEKLKRYGHPLNSIMDIESMVLFLLGQAARGVPPEKVRKTGIKI